MQSSLPLFLSLLLLPRWSDDSEAQKKPSSGASFNLVPHAPGSLATALHSHPIQRDDRTAPECVEKY
uniref:Putative secreted protein n=1 Tax=Anopheles darlingi TaxID=43151 RepID=A0A2M4DDS7_ANODA